MAAPYFPKPCWDFENPPQDGHPYVFEMFGELYFTENPPKPVTMSDLFGDNPQPPLPPKAKKDDASDGQDDEGGEQEAIANDADPVYVENQTPPEPRRRRLMTRADLYNYVPPENEEPNVYPPVIHPLRPLYNGDPLFQYVCDHENGCKCPLPQEENAVGEGGSSSGVKKEDLA